MAEAETRATRKTKEQLISELVSLGQRLETDEGERKEVEEKLKQSLAVFAEAQRVAHLGSWVWDIVRDTTTWSDELYDIFGISPEQLNGNAYDAFLDCIHPQDRKGVELVMQKALADRSRFSLEYRIVRQDRAVRTLAARGDVICDETGAPVRMVGVSQDITERKKVEESLEWESGVNAALAALANSLVGLPRSLAETAEIVLAQARALTRSGHGYVASLDPQSGDNIIHAFTAAVHTFQVPEEAKGIRFSKGSDSLYGGLWRRTLNTKKAFYTSSPDAHPSSRGTPEGHTPLHGLLSVPVMMAGKQLGRITLANPESPYGDRELDAVKRIGKLYALALQRHRVNEELTEHQQNLQRLVQLREVELLAANGGVQRLSSAVEQTADSVLITNRRGVIEYVNPAFEDTTGYEKEEVLGQTPSILKSGRHDADFYRSLWATLLGGKVYRGTIVNRRKSGELYWAEQTITPMRDEGGNITHFVSVLKDVTEQRKLQEQELQMRLAQEVQQRFYQSAVPPRLDGFDIAGAAYPADTIGGDYLDFIPMADGRLGIAVGDVSGHGFGSSLVMAETRAYLRSFAESERDVGKILTRVNQVLAADLEGGRFVTLVLACLDPTSRSIEYASAGHVSGYILDPSGEVMSELESTCCPLGLFPNCEVPPSRAITLQPGQLLALFTDGITEAMAPDETEFGTERTLESLRTCLHKPAQQILEHVYETALGFAGGRRSQHDDITAIICKLVSAR